MHQLEFVVDLLVWSFLSGFAGVVVGQLLPSRVATLRVATWPPSGLPPGSSWRPGR